MYHATDNITRESRATGATKQECVDDTYSRNETEAYSMLFEGLRIDWFEDPRMVPNDRHF